jgi:hypothetical protein
LSVITVLPTIQFPKGTSKRPLAFISIIEKQAQLLHDDTIGFEAVDVLIQNAIEKLVEGLQLSIGTEI